MMRFPKGAKADPETTLETLKLVIYLVPIFGFFPSLWSLYRRGGSRREQTASRTAVTLALAWLLVYGVTGVGAQSFDSLTARFLVTGLLSTTGYFVTNMWLMVRLLQGKSVRLPGLSRWSDRLP
ncbi:MAG: hypothetical protein O2890_15970 [Cyanobacteria bacterium]|nr:hypothetical protein [Cyanobacteriota bacterium]